MSLPDSRKASGPEAFSFDCCEGRVLIIKPTALGDVAQALRVVPLLAEVHEHCQIDWVVDEDYLPLVSASPRIRKAIAFPRRKWRQSRAPGDMIRWAVRELRAQEYDVALDLQGLARSGLMTLAARAPVKIGLESAREGAGCFYHACVPDRKAHAVDRYRQAVEWVAGRRLPSEHYHTLSKEAFKQCPVEEDYVVLHPYSLWETKLWPWEYYSKLAQCYPEKQFVVVGKGEHFPLFADNIMDLRNETSLSELISILANASAVVSTDSGPAHVAAAFGVPVTTLFGATDERLTSPVGSLNQVLSTSISCRPCLKRTCFHDKSMACMRELSFREVHI